MADGTGDGEKDAVDRTIVLLVAVPGENGVDAILFEQLDIMTTLIHREVEVVLRLIHRLADNGTMKKNEGTQNALA